MKEEAQATPKTIGNADIQAIANKAGLTLSELLEWGIYCIMETFDGTMFQPSEALDELRRLQNIEGKIQKDIIPSNPLAEFAANIGMHFGEVSELALLSAISIMNSSEFPDKKPRDFLEELRQEHGALIPSFKEEKTAVHPFMHRLFSGDLRAIHGPTFGDLASDDVGMEHLFLEQVLNQAFERKDWSETMCDLMAIESVIRYCPKLRNEAAAIQALIEAEKVIGDFCRAVNAA